MIGVTLKDNSKQLILHYDMHDIKYLRPDWTIEQCNQMLDYIEEEVQNEILDSMLALIDKLLPQEPVNE